MGLFGTFSVAEKLHIDTPGEGNTRLELDLEPGDYEPASVAELQALLHLSASAGWMHPDAAGPPRALAEMTAPPTPPVPGDTSTSSTSDASGAAQPDPSTGGADPPPGPDPGTDTP